MSDDLQTLKLLFTKAGIVYRYDSIDNTITVEAGDGDNNRGYSGFLTTFTFDDNGTLTSIGSWE